MSSNPNEAPNGVAVSVRGLSKSYSIAHNAAKHTTAGEALMHRLRHPFAREERETFWALNDVSFDIQKGDVVGIIGRNGAGKSTLLKILSRITEPTKGRIDLYGRVGSLLEVGTGFHPELTGRENIFLNGAILGMSRAEIARQFDAIVDFSGTEQFLDTPVKRYSSGMYVRLAFAVAAHLNPEILIVDEVLAVGDADFQKKCLGKMHDVAASGRTVLFVSHNMAAVSNLCSRAIMLQNGELIHIGDTEASIKQYTLSGSQMHLTNERGVAPFRPSWAQSLITNVRIANDAGSDQNCFPLGSSVTFELSFKTPKNSGLASPVMGVVINHLTFGTVGGVNTRMTGFHKKDGNWEHGVFRCRLPNVNLLQGQYAVDFWLGDGPSNLDTLASVLAFSIEEGDIYKTGRTPIASLGVVFFEPEWHLDSNDVDPPTLNAIKNHSGRVAFPDTLIAP